MKKELLCVFIIAALSTGCGNSFLCSVDKRIAVYQATDTNNKQPVFFLEYGKNVLAQRTKKGFRKITYGNRSGYILKRRFSKEIRCTEREVRNLYFDGDSTYTFRKYKRIYPETAEYSNNDSKTSSTRTIAKKEKESPGGRVQVRGYYRSNGTYVRPHTRSSPGKR